MLTLTGCVVTKCNSTDDGGGMTNDGIAWLTDCVIAKNKALDDGGGIDNDDGVLR